jgi:integrase
MKASAKPRSTVLAKTHEPDNPLLANQHVRDWYESRRLRSHLSADVYLRQIRSTLGRLGLTPDEATSLAKQDPDHLRRLLIHYATKLKEEGLLDSYIAKTFDGLRSYFQFHGVAFAGFPKLSPIRGASLSRERVPTPEELGRALERLPLRGRLILLTMAHTGVRPGVLGGYRAERGLTLGDLPDLDHEKLEFKEVPFVVRVPANLSKTRVSYVSFGTTQLASVLLATLIARRERGEKLEASSPVVAVNDVRGDAKRRHESSNRGRFLTTKAIVAQVREALHASAPEGVTFRPYVARSYCSTRLLLAEGAGRMSRDLREAILGHDTGVSGRYTVGKRWGNELLAEARKEYRGASEFLETNVATKTDDKREYFLSWVKAIEEQTGKKVDGQGTTAEDLVTALKRVLRDMGSEGSAKGPTEPAPQPQKTGQKVVLAEEVEAWIEKGARYVAPLNGTKAIIEFP